MVLHFLWGLWHRGPVWYVMFKWELPPLPLTPLFSFFGSLVSEIMGLLSWSGLVLPLTRF